MAGDGTTYEPSPQCTLHCPTDFTYKTQIQRETSYTFQEGGHRALNSRRRAPCCCVNHTSMKPVPQRPSVDLLMVSRAKTRTRSPTSSSSLPDPSHSSSSASRSPGQAETFPPGPCLRGPHFGVTASKFSKCPPGPGAWDYLGQHCSLARTLRARSGTHMDSPPHWCSGTHAYRLLCDQAPVPGASHERGLASGPLLLTDATILSHDSMRLGSQNGGLSSDHHRMSSGLWGAHNLPPSPGMELHAGTCASPVCPSGME